LSYGGERNYYT